MLRARDTYDNDKLRNRTGKLEEERERETTGDEGS